jgi:hypothetical protein
MDCDYWYTTVTREWLCSMRKQWKIHRERERERERKRERENVSTFVMDCALIGPKLLIASLNHWYVVLIPLNYSHNNRIHLRNLDHGMYARSHVHMHACMHVLWLCTCTCRPLARYVHVRAQGLQKHLAANLVDNSYLVIWVACGQCVIVDLPADAQYSRTIRCMISFSWHGIDWFCLKFWLMCCMKIRNYCLYSIIFL